MRARAGKLRYDERVGDVELKAVIEEVGERLIAVRDGEAPPVGQVGVVGDGEGFAAGPRVVAISGERSPEPERSGLVE